MMPWEHAIVGYIAYSLFTHIVYRSAPTGAETVVVLVASVLPDVIDKPLAWEFGIFSSGYAIGHSIFFAVPISTAIFLLTLIVGRPRFGWAFGIGYLLHLPADVIPIYVQEGRMPLERILWPMSSLDGRSEVGFTEAFAATNDQYLQSLAELNQSPYMQAVALLMLGGFLLWVYDGMPIVREGYLALRQAVVWSTRQLRKYWRGDST
ncbi:metal-dependent hydrolase [Natrialbaceae archaeon A-CW2]